MGFTPELTFRFRGISVQMDATGNLIGTIHPETLSKELKQITPNKNGVVRFFCEKRRKQPTNGKTYSHMEPTCSATIATPTAPLQDAPVQTTPVPTQKKRSFFPFL